LVLHAKSAHATAHSTESAAHHAAHHAATHAAHSHHTHCVHRAISTIASASKALYVRAADTSKIVILKGAFGLITKRGIWAGLNLSV